MADRTFARGQRMAKHWHFIPSVSQSLTANGTALGGGLALDGPWTVIRMLGDLMIAATPGGTFVSADEARVAVAIGVISSDAFAAGAASVPDPSAEPDYPWLYFRELGFLFAGASPAGDELTAHVRINLDIRSMRKLKPRETLAFVMQYVDVNGAPPMTIQQSIIRVLVAT